jgi:hypothetical protein
MDSTYRDPVATPTDARTPNAELLTLREDRSMALSSLRFQRPPRCAGRRAHHHRVRHPPQPRRPCGNWLLRSAGSVRLNTQRVRQAWHGRCGIESERQGSVVGGRVVRRVVAPTVATAVAGSLVAVALSLATEWKSNPWAWLAVVVTTALVAAATLWLDRRQGDPPEPERPSGGQVVTNSTIHGPNFQVGGDVSINRDRERSEG